MCACENTRPDYRAYVKVVAMRTGAATRCPPFEADFYPAVVQGISHLEQPPSDLPAEAHGCRTQGGAALWPRTTRLLAHFQS